MCAMSIKRMRINRIGDLAQRGKSIDARIGRRAGRDHCRANFFRLFLQRVVIDLLGLFVHAVLRDLIKFAGKIRGMAVGEMTAMRQIHGQDFVARFNRGEIDRHVSLRTAVRLHIDMFGAEETLRAIDRQLLDDIDILATAIPAFPGIAFRVFVRQARTLRFHDRAAGEIFRSDEFDVFALPFFFRRDGVKNFRIGLAQAAAGRENAAG